MSFKAYPLQFVPIFKERIWGGEKLKTILDKSIESKNIGESWELSTVEGDVSTIANGQWNGKKLTEIIQEFPVEILGTRVYNRFGKIFPLLFKYLDAKEDLSIQVHPNDELAKERHDSFGKTEMWYIMQADEQARVILGFKEKSNKEEYLKNLQEKTLLPKLEEIKVKEGDVYFLETGTIHAIGAGIVLAEIQQTSDITYRVYDWDRVDANGNSRELHVDYALDAMNYDVLQTHKTYSKEVNKPNELVNCSYFTTNFLPVEGVLEVNKDKETFTVYMCVEGTFEIKHENTVYKYKKGDTVLIPASMNVYKLCGNASVLEIYIL
ncbi:MAG: type I phosphomannose isomerase catalytic subunit [Flavobacterium sp.]